jgi:hypothetical protein
MLSGCPTASKSVLRDPSCELREKAGSSNERLEVINVFLDTAQLPPHSSVRSLRMNTDPKVGSENVFQPKHGQPLASSIAEEQEDDNVGGCKGIETGNEFSQRSPHHGSRPGATSGLFRVVPKTFARYDVGEC